MRLHASGPLGNQVAEMSKEVAARFPLRDGGRCLPSVDPTPSF